MRRREVVAQSCSLHSFVFFFVMKTDNKCEENKKKEVAVVQLQIHRDLKKKVIHLQGEAQ